MGRESRTLSLRMAFLELMLDGCFRNDSVGRVVIFSGGRRNRGYLVKSEADELKIRSFLKMFLAAHLAILLLGMQLALTWGHDVAFMFDRPAHHLFRTGGISLAIYSVVVILPYFFLWRSYRKAIFNFVSPQDEVEITAERSKRGMVIGIAVAAFGVLLMLGVFLLVRAK
jgi:hypothetical protein